MNYPETVTPPTPQEIQEANDRQKRYEDAMEKLISQRDALMDANNEHEGGDWDKYRQHLKDLPAMVVNIPMPIDLDEDGNLVGVEWPELDEDGNLVGVEWPEPPAPAPANEEDNKENE